MKPVTSFSNGFVCLGRRMKIDEPYIVECGDLKFVVEYNYETLVFKVRIAN